MKQLLLQRLSSCRYDDFSTRQQRGRQISKSFSRARARFHHKLLLVFDDLRDRVGHVQLRLPGFKSGDRLGERTLFGKALGYRRVQTLMHLALLETDLVETVLIRRA